MSTDVQIKPQVYKDERPAEYFEQFHERTRSGPPEWIYEVVRATTVMVALTAYRARGIDSQLVPNGPVILAPNHASFMDHFFTGAFIRRRIQFMAKSQLFKPGILTWIFSHGGVFPVRRGSADE
jgi:1-acyl-sn-glycerol-3-phosphate acyltransferase